MKLSLWLRRAGFCSLRNHQYYESNLLQNSFELPLSALLADIPFPVVLSVPKRRNQPGICAEISIKFLWIATDLTCLCLEQNTLWTWQIASFTKSNKDWTYFLEGQEKKRNYNTNNQKFFKQSWVNLPLPNDAVSFINYDIVFSSVFWFFWINTYVFREVILTPAAGPFRSAPNSFTCVQHPCQLCPLQPHLCSFYSSQYPVPSLPCSFLSLMEQLQ